MAGYLIERKGDRMTLDKLLQTLGERDIPIELKEGKIAVPPGVLTPALRAAIIAHKPELVFHLQSLVANKLFIDHLQGSITAERKNPGAIRLNYAIDWFGQATRRIHTSCKILTVDRGRQKARLSPPTSCSWLIGWLPKGQWVEFEEKGDLPWTDWNDVMGDVRGKFERNLEL